MLAEVRDTKASMWISASAGTGKTKNLIDRILALLLDGAVPSQILCLTYTKAAANEMLERLSSYLRKIYLMKDSEIIAELNSLGFSKHYLKRFKELYEQSLKNDWVNIQTIHSFAFYLMKQFPMSRELYSGAKLCDDIQRQQLFEEAQRFVLSNPDLRNDLRTIARYTFSLSNLLQDEVFFKVRKFFANLPDDDSVKNFFLTQFDDVEERLLNMFYIDAQKEILKQVLGENFQEQFQRVIEKLRYGNKTDNENADRLEVTVTKLSEDFLRAVLSQKLEPYAKPCSKELMKDESLVKDLQDILRKAELYLRRKRDLVSAQMNIAFFRVLRVFIDKFSDIKREQHLIDYDDIILSTLQMLRDGELSWVLYKIDRNISHILVDEAQDTSPEQWEIIRRLSGEFFTNYKSEKTIFVVGDEKQSIYSFQGANVAGFNEMHDYFKSLATACGQNFYDVELNKSYRSDKNILRFVDEVLSENNNPKSAANWFANMKHETVKENFGAVEFMTLFSSSEEPKDEDGDEEETVIPIKEKSKNQMAEYIAEFIDSAIKNEVLVKDNSRAAQPGDFYILFQRRDPETMNTICEALHERGIPNSGVDKILLGHEIIVEDLIAIAELTLSPFDDLLCARVLKSPLVEMSEEDLMHACLDRKDQDLLHCVLQNNEFRAKYPVSKIEEYCALQKSCADFFMHILCDGLREKFLKRFGVGSLGIIDEFMSVCTKFEREYSPNLAKFLQWFRKYDQTVKREFFGSENEVRLMTVHAAKGLQAPFIILADSHFDTTSRSPILSDDTDEDFPKLFWNFDSKLASDCVRKLIDDAKKFKLEESLRVLYVALTRAESYLLILGQQKKNKISANSWYSKIVNSDLLHGETSFKLGEYVQQQFSPADENAIIASETSEKVFVLPDWYYEKIPAITEKTPSAKEFSSDETEFGRCVHYLLEIFAIYGKETERIAIYSMKKFILSEDDKGRAFQEAKDVFQKFPQLFDKNSQAEVTLSFDGQEHRIDKIAQIDGETWIIDFKTGTQHETVPQYRNQLFRYKNIYENISGHPVRIAILWTQTLDFVEVV